MEPSSTQINEIPAINRFLGYCRVRTVPSRTVLIHAGDLPDALYYIIRGSVEVMIEDEEGNEMVLAYLNKGQFFGEMGLFSDSQQRSAWVRTRTQCELAEMTYPRFRQVAAESPGLVFELATQLATRLDRTNRKLGDLAFVDVTGRIAQSRLGTTASIRPARNLSTRGESIRQRMKNAKRTSTASQTRSRRNGREYSSGAVRFLAKGQPSFAARDALRLRCRSRSHAEAAFHIPVLSRCRGQHNSVTRSPQKSKARSVPEGTGPARPAVPRRRSA